MNSAMPSTPLVLPTIASPLLPLPLPVLLKAISLIAAGFSVHTFNHPPHGMGHNKQDTDERDLGEPLKIELPVRMLVPVFKKLAWVVPAVELYLSSQRGATEGWQVTPQMLIGAGLGIYSVYIRYRCHAALGKRFTIGLSTYKSERLPLVTSGPYASVRHPSYTAIIMAMWSLTLIINDPTSSISRATGAWWLTRLVMNGLSIFETLYLPFWRIPFEENMLLDEFGADWDAYTRKTRWILIPGVW